MLTSKEMLQRSPIALAVVKVESTFEKLKKNPHHIIFFVSSNRNYLKNLSQYDEFNKSVLQNRNYIYEF